MQTLAERLQAALDRRPELSQAGLARACGISTASVSNWFTGDTLTLKAKNARLAASYLGCSRDWLETGVGTPNWTHAYPPKGGNVVHLKAQELSLLNPYPLGTSTTRVPVVGHLEMAASKELFLRLNPEGPIGSVPTMAAAPDSFAVRVTGDHLYPAVRHGACLVIEPTAALVPGEPVFIETKAGSYLIGDLIADRRDEITVASLNGPARTTLPRSDVARAHAITSIVMASRFQGKAAD